MKHRRVRTDVPKLTRLRLAAVRMTHDPPKRAAKPAPNDIALVVRGHVQRGFWLKMKAEALK